MENSKVIEVGRRFREKTEHDQREKCESFFNTFIEAHLALEIHQSLCEVFTYERGMDEDMSLEEEERIQLKVDKLVNRIRFYLNNSTELFLAAYKNAFDENFEEILNDLDEQLERDVELRGYTSFILNLFRQEYSKREQKKEEKRTDVTNVVEIKIPPRKKRTQS